MKPQRPDNRRRCEILLIHPPWFRLQGSSLTPYPVGPAYVAGILEKAGMDALIWNGDFDADAPMSVGGTNILKTNELTRMHERFLARLDDSSDPIWHESLEIIKLTRPKIVGLSAYSSSFKSASNVARIVKRFDPSIITVLGGIHASIDPEGCLRSEPAIDLVAIGEAELTAPRLFQTLLRNGIEQATLAEMPGIAFRNKGVIQKTEKGPVIDDLDEAPLPARHLLIDLDKMPPHAFQSLYGFRGCPFKCIFCGSFNVHGRKARIRSARSMVEEIEMVHREYGTRYFYICDDIFLLRKPRALEFVSLLQRKNLPIFYSIQTRGEMLDLEILKKLKRTGCQHIAVGVEVGDDEIRARIKKGNTVADMRAAAEMIRKAGLRMVGFFMFGFPWEDKEQMLKTASLMEDLDPCVAFPYIVTPSPGTELFTIAEGMGLLNGDVDLSSFHHESPRMGLTSKIPEFERVHFIDEILERFAKQNRRKIRKDVFKRPWFYWAVARDAGLTSSWPRVFKYLTAVFAGE